MNEEYKQLMNEMKQTSYSKKPQWAKYLDNQARKERRKRTIRNQYEVLVDSEIFNYKEF